MNVAGLMGLSALLLHLPTLLISVYFDKVGLPAGLGDQTTPRKRGTLAGRLPRIGLNLLGLYGLALPALGAVDHLFPMAAPPVWLGVLQFGLLVLADDLWFYFAHRFMHENKEVYRRVHKIHHEAFAPVPIEYIYVHPVELMIGTLGPVIVIAATLLLAGEMSAFVLVAWQAWRTLHEIDIHSGLRSPFTAGLPLWAGTRHHDLHHARPTLGNYASSLTLWDRLLGTAINPAGAAQRGGPPEEPAA